MTRAESHRWLCDLRLDLRAPLLAAPRALRDDADDDGVLADHSDGARDPSPKGVEVDDLHSPLRNWREPGLDERDAPDACDDRFLLAEPPGSRDGFPDRVSGETASEVHELESPLTKVLHGRSENLDARDVWDSDPPLVDVS